jgi:peptide chain release factor 1
MNPRLEVKVQTLLERLSEVEQALGQPDIFSDQKKYKELTQEHSYLTEVRSTWEEGLRCVSSKSENLQMLEEEKDPAFIDILKEEISTLDRKLEGLNQKLDNLLVPPDPNDHRNTILELRAGTGGSEAALFVGDCVRMYKLFADKQGWNYDHLSSAPSELGGFKEYIMVLSGQNVHRLLQYEGGTHRVQRVPDTEAQGRIHTSAMTIAVLLEPDEETEIVLDERDLKIDTYRSSGAGGQHVNTTDSAVRITHVPTGTVVYCQEERSQHKNKEKAMRHLKAKIAEVEREKAQKELDSKRSSQVGSGDRSERIRTYNFPQNRVTDHRINLTVYNLDRVMQGSLDEIVNALVAHFYQEDLTA